MEAFTDPEVQEAFRGVMLWSAFDVSLKAKVQELADLLWSKYGLEWEQLT